MNITPIQRFVEQLIKDGIFSRSDYRSWADAYNHKKYLSSVFDYNPTSDDAPDIKQLIGVDYHPTENLVLVNYTPAALQLYKYGGWPDAIRQARGVVVDYYGNLIARPYPRMSDSRYQETQELIIERIEDKMDGHLGIIFFYNNNLYITTRGSFTSQSAQIGKSLLYNYNTSKLPKNCTTLVEIIHPDTKVLVDYKGKRELVLLGCIETSTNKQYSRTELEQLSKDTDLPLVPVYNGTFDDMLKQIDDINNHEGYIVVGKDEQRTKYKTKWFLDVKEKSKPIPKKKKKRRIIIGQIQGTKLLKKQIRPKKFGR